MIINKNDYNMKKVVNDILLIISLCILAGLACFLIYFKDDEYSAMQLQVIINGEVTNTYYFEDLANTKEEIRLEIGNIVVIEDGHVYMKYADCPDGLCIKQGKISREGESIICLPHKLVIRIVSLSEDKENPDKGNSGNEKPESSVEEGLDVIPR